MENLIQRLTNYANVHVMVRKHKININLHGDIGTVPLLSNDTVESQFNTSLQELDLSFFSPLFVKVVVSKTVIDCLGGWVLC